MAKTFPKILLAALLVPTFWTVDKLLQLYATVLAIDIAREQVQDEVYLSKLFSISRPFDYADYFTLEAKSLSENRIPAVLSNFDKETAKPFRIFVEYTDPLTKKHWFEYPTGTCIVVHCTYDPKMLRPISPMTEKDATYASRMKAVRTNVLFYTFTLEFYLGAYSNGKITDARVDLSSMGRNPIDRSFRDFMGSHAPDYWWIQWHYSKSAVTGLTVEERF